MFGQNRNSLNFLHAGYNCVDRVNSAKIFGLGRDAIELLDALNIRRVHFLGLSLGGMVGQWLGIHAPERIDRLILSNTAAYLGPAKEFHGRITGVLKASRAETAETFLRNWFPPNLLESDRPIITKTRAGLLATDPQGFAGSLAAVRDMDMRRTISPDLPSNPGNRRSIRYGDARESQ